MRKIFRKKNLIIGFSILMLIGFERYWLKMAYKQEIERIESESTRLLLSATRKKEAKVFDQMMDLRLEAWKEGRRPRIFGPTLFADSLLPPEFEAQMDSLIRTESHRIMRHLPDGDITSLIASVAQKMKLLSPNDSAKFRTVIFENSPFESEGDADSLKFWIHNEYHTANLPTDFELVHFRGRRKGPGESAVGNGIHSHTAHVKLTGQNFVVVFHDYKWFAFKQLIPEIGLSLMVLGAVIFSFIILIRSQKKAEELARMKGDFISNMTHNLKTPIATVSVALEALRNFGAAANPERTREYLDISASELERLSFMVDKTLELSALTGEEIALDLQKQDLQPIVEDALAFMHPQFEKYQARIQFKSEDFVYPVNVDKSHTLNVIANLLENAIKYRSEDPLITVSLERTGSTILLKVEDNGIGISRKALPHIFDNFYRAPSLETHPSKGNGMGLAYAKTVIRKMKGRIRVESEEGKGTTMIIELPATDERS